jgi:hypothetical protein
LTVEIAAALSFLSVLITGRNHHFVEQSAQQSKRDALLEGRFRPWSESKVDHIRLPNDKSMSNRPMKAFCSQLLLYFNKPAISLWTEGLRMGRYIALWEEKNERRVKHTKE